MTQTRNKPIRVTKEIIAKRESQRVAMKAALMAPLAADTAVSNVIKTLRKPSHKYEQLFQDSPNIRCTATHKKNKNYKNRSHTNSLESQQNGARRELEILTRNGRMPTKQITLRFQIQFKTKKEMTDLLTKLFRYLGEHGIIAAVALEGTDGDFGKPSNRVHCHILIDDKEAPRSKKNLIALFEKACKLRGLERGEDIKIGYGTIPKDFSFDYFVKLGKHGRGIHLFKRGLRIRKFRYIGGWFVKPKKQINDEYVAEMKRIYAAKNASKLQRSQ